MNQLKRKGGCGQKRGVLSDGVVLVEKEKKESRKKKEKEGFCQQRPSGDKYRILSHFPLTSSLPLQEFVLAYPDPEVCDDNLKKSVCRKGKDILEQVHSSTTLSITKEYAFLTGLH